MKKALRRGLDRLPRGGVSDRIYLFIMFLYAQRRVPRRGSGLFNDYLYFMKRSPRILDVLRQMTSDKILVKTFVQEQCGEGLTVETTAVFKSVSEINLSEWPKPCVIKPAHGSGGVVFVDDGQDSLNAADKVVLSNALESSPYKSAREANYRYLRPRLVCEPMLTDGKAISDYKVFCYKGRPRLVQVDTHRHTNHRRNIYQKDWTPLNIRYNFPVGEWESAPQCLTKMLAVASKLSAPFDFVRVDFFVQGDVFYVGELTHCPESAHGRFSDIESEKIFSDILFCSEHG